jgi:Domain of unknown function (DUF4375)
MEDFPNASASAFDPVGEVFDRWADGICEVLDEPGQYARVIAGMPGDIVNIVCANTLHGEVLNGGFSQYFSNSFGIAVNEAIRGLEALGLHEYAQISRDAKAVLGTSFPVDPMERFRLVEDNRRRGLAFESQTERFIELANSNRDRDMQAFNSYAATVLKRYAN